VRRLTQQKRPEASFPVLVRPLHLFPQPTPALPEPRPDRMSHSDAKLHRLLMDRSDGDPYALAYGTVRYGALAARAARFAGTLREAGVRWGDCVAVCLDGCVEYLVAYYGTLMAGATVVPLSPEIRGASLHRVLDHCGATAIVAPGQVLERLADHGRTPARLRVAFHVDAPEGLLPPTLEVMDFAVAEKGGREIFDTGAQGSALACVSYTSGTTGAPKGVMLSHDNLVANTRSILEYLELGPTDRVAMVLPYHYVYGNSVLHTHLAAGGSIVEAGSTAFPAKVLETIRNEGCTGLSGVPSTFASLVRVREPERFDLSTLRYLTQAGGAMTPALTRRVRATFPAAELYVMYGQTEAGARLSYLPPCDVERKLGSVGIPIPGVSLSVVDASGRPVVTGTIGEIVASGPNVMVGYLGEPTETDRALRDGVLHTGDMGYVDADGYLYISGRNNEMISSGGHRIGPQEVENVISSLPGVAECAVVGVKDEMLGERLVAAVVLQDGERGDARLIQRTCLAELPRYKVPAEVRFVAELPYSDRGKLLRSEIRAQFENGVVPSPLVAAEENRKPTTPAPIKTTARPAAPL
jgi:long-chain acyl-CoA synthetase